MGKRAARSGGAGPSEPRATRLIEVAWLFLKLGTIAFGGPAAHIAMMEAEVVQRRRWLSRDEFLDLLGAANLIPGPSSTELAIFIGYRRVGWPGLVLGGVCFILPAALLVAAIAWAYVRFGTLPQLQGILYGVKPVVLAVVVQALWGLSRTAVKNRFLALLGAAACAASLLGVDQLLILVAAGALAASQSWAGDRRQGPPVTACLAGLALTCSAPAAAAAAPTTIPFGLMPLFLTFLKVGAFLFGSGYVLLAFLKADLVTRLGWLTERQLLDAVAVGQITPGPVFTTATFVGYILGGPVAALVATVGIFLPSFFFVALSGLLLPLLRRSALVGAALDGVIVASLALMATVTLSLGQTAIVDRQTATMALLAGFLLLRYRLNSAWLIAAGALLGSGMA